MSETTTTAPPEPPKPKHETVPPGGNPFGKQVTKAKVQEQIALNIFRLATYGIILAAATIFLMIAWRGAPVVFGSFKTTDTFPYFTNTFLATSPETLHVFPIAQGEVPGNVSTLSQLSNFTRQTLEPFDADDGRRNLAFDFTWQGQSETMTRPELEELLEETGATFGDLQREAPVRYQVMNQLGDSLFRLYSFNARWAYFSELDGLTNVRLAYSPPSELPAAEDPDKLDAPANASAPAAREPDFIVPLAELEAHLAERETDLYALVSENVVSYRFELDGTSESLGQSAWEEWLVNQDYTPITSQTFSYAGGGILFPIVGTLLLSVGAMAIALTLGVLCAIFLSEYSRAGTLLDTVRLSVLNLAGVPSIVFGIFGFGMFVIALDLGVSLTAGCFTLAFMVLPIVIAASEESLRAVPMGFREGSLALGATKWQSIRTNVLPYALPGILTSSILGLTRVAGETAPIMYTAAFARASQFPWQGEHWWEFFVKGVMALPYHIYVVSLQINRTVYTEPMQFGASFVFLMLVGGFALASILLRVRMRKLYRW
ncbi:MAG: phosphate ABC transporter permease PstA [Opitutales bacterium]